MKLPFTKVAPYYFTTLQRWVPDALELLLKAHVYQEIRPEQALSSGFVHALDEGVLVETVAPGTVYLRYKITEKKVPKKVLLDAMQPFIAEWEEANSAKMPRPDLLALQEKCYNELIKVAFPTDKIVDVLLTPTHAYIGDPNWKRGEMVLNRLRAALGSLPVRPLACRKDFQDLMTDRLLGRQKDPLFGLGDRFSAKNVDTKAEVKGNHVEVNSDEFQALVEDGMKVSELELTFRADPEHATSTWFVLKKDGILKAIVYPPELSDQASEDAGDDKTWSTLMRTNLLLIHACLVSLVLAVEDECGGLLFEGDQEEPKRPTAHIAVALTKLLELSRVEWKALGFEDAILAFDAVENARASALSDITGGARITLAEITDLQAADPSAPDPADCGMEEPPVTSTADEDDDVESLI